MKNLQKTSNYSYYTSRTGMLQYYINDISKYKILTQKESKEAVKKAKKGDQKAIASLVNSNQRFVLSLSKRFSSGNNTLLLDLINEANIGLLKSIETFDINKENVFLTYAVYWMQRQIFSYITFTEPLIKITNKNKTTRVSDIKNKFFLQNGRNPTSEEIINELYNNYGINITDDSHINELITFSMDSSLSLDGFEDYSNYYANSIQTSDDENNIISKNTVEMEIENDYNKKLISNSIGVLTDKEKRVIELLYGFNQYRNYETKEVAEQVGVSPEGVRQIEKRALEKIKNEICLQKHNI